MQSSYSRYAHFLRRSASIYSVSSPISPDYLASIFVILYDHVCGSALGQVHPVREGFVDVAGFIITRPGFGFS